MRAGRFPPRPVVAALMRAKLLLGWLATDGGDMIQ